jgi:hypothetical protein
MNKDWSCEKKQQARLSTIVEQYRYRYGHSVPKQMQYWSMAGLCDKPGCEIDQLLQSGLITAGQFHGVEIKRDVHERSAIAYPDANWHRGDFYRVMSRASGRGQFRPAIVNADLIQMVETGGQLISDIMMLLSDYPNVMFVANFVLGTRHHKVQTGDHVLAELNKQPNFQAFSECWNFDDSYYEYAGTGKTKVTMGSFVFSSTDRVARIAA